jgi:Protein of unknown function (DUF2891)
MSWLNSPNWRLIAADAHEFAQCVLHVLSMPFPYAMQHLTMSAEDRPLPHEVHPVFGTCYDWHSAVHMHWTLLRLRRLGCVPDLHLQIDQWFEERFTEQSLAAEQRYFEAAGRAHFERPYGWAWYLMLAAEAQCYGTTLQQQGKVKSAWIDRLTPMAKLLGQRLSAYLRQARLPERSGGHGNSAFACVLARSAAAALGWPQLAKASAHAALAWFASDAAYPVAYEPSAGEFLSPGLLEATLMAEVLGPRSAEWQSWWQRFCPSDASVWQEPVTCIDRRDPQAVHLDGLNLSRVWCWRRIESQGIWPGVDTSAIAMRHWKSAREHIYQGEFLSTHWLASFAVLALTGDHIQPLNLVSL